MPVVVKEAPRIGMSNKMIVETVFYANCRKCLTDTMIASARTGMIAVPHVAQKMRLVSMVHHVVRLHEFVQMNSSLFVVKKVKCVSIIVVVIPLMQMRRNVVRME